MAEQEEKRRRELAIKVEDHKAMQERNLATLDVVRKPKEATAAMAQVDMLKKVLSQEETDLHSLSLRVHDVHHAIDGQQKALDELDARQQEQRAAHAAERAEIESRARESEEHPRRAGVARAEEHSSQVRAHPEPQHLERALSVARPGLRPMRYRDPDAASQRNRGRTRDRCVRGVRSASVRGRMMVVAPPGGR